MWILERLHESIDRIAYKPPLKTLRKQRFDRCFESAPDHNLFRGVYRTFDEAVEAAPKTKPMGYDNPAAADMYHERRTRIHSTDYPPLFWLSSLIAQVACRHVLDIGGHVGVTYYAYSRFIDYPRDLTWTVHDVPAVTRRGREIAAVDDTAGKLSFVDSLQHVIADIALANGSLQYLAHGPADWLDLLVDRPPHVIINMLPVHPSLSYFTVQDIGTAFCPYQIFAEPLLLRDFAEAGYGLVDRWENIDKRCRIPFAPEHSLDKYFGYHFSTDVPATVPGSFTRQ